MKNNNTRLSKFLPYIVAIVSFVAICAAYFAPQFEGKKVVMHDMVQYEGMSKEITDHKEQYGEDPQWTGAMFGGMPAPLIAMDHDSMVIRKIHNVLDFMGRPAGLIFIAMLSFFVMLLLFGVDPWVGIAPSLAYGLSTYFFLIIGAGHITKIIAMAYAPLMIGGMGYTFRKNIWLGAALTALFASLEISAGHPQITYYFLFVMIALWINEGVRSFREKTLSRFAKATGLLAIAAVMAVGSNLSPLWQINEYGKESMRGGGELTSTSTEGAKKKGSGLELDYVTAWSYGKAESFNIYIPNFMGGASDVGFASDGEVAQSLAKYGERKMAPHLPGYWGDQPSTAGPTYVGAVVIYLCMLGLFLLRGRYKWWVLAVSALALMLAWGENFMWFTKLFYYYVPGYNKFRTVAMILVIVQWSIPFLAALILHKIYKSEITKAEVIRGVKNALYVTGGVALFFLLLGGWLFDFSGSVDARIGLPDDVVAAMRSERASMMKMDSLRSLVFVLLSAGVVWWFAMGKMKKWVLVVAFGVLVCADLIPVNLRYLPQSKFVDKELSQVKPTEANLQIMKDKSPGYRVFNMTVSPFNDALTSYFHRSVGGYHGAKMQRYQDIIDRHLSKMNWEVYNMLNTKYIITAEKEGGKARVELNPDANGAAWFVESVSVVESANEEINALNYLDTKRDAVVDRRFAEYLPTLDGSDSVGLASIELTEYRANKLTYKYHSDRQRVAVFSEVYYPKGWEAYVDGEAVPHFRANYILRAMVLPAGDHTVEFRYRAAGFDTVSAITLTFSLLIILSIIAAATVVVVKGKKKREHDAE